MNKGTSPVGCWLITSTGELGSLRVNKVGPPTWEVDIPSIHICRNLGPYSMICPGVVAAFNGAVRGVS